jgi:hypothetical protein
MQTLVFNTTQKEVTLWSDLPSEAEVKLLGQWINASTVKVENGYYEIIQKYDDGETYPPKSYPVFRCPISNTNMLIER